jgi:hypothetical protein
MPKWFWPYTLWRFVGLRSPALVKKYPRPPFPTHITSEYRWLLDEWDRVRVALAWIAAGRPLPRPAILWRNDDGVAVTPGYLRRLRDVLAAEGHPPVPPTPSPVPQPHPAQKLGTFARPGAWLSWEVLSLGYTAAQIAREAAQLNCGWVALDAAINPVGDRNLSVFPDVAAECRKVGIKAGLWGEIHSGVDAANRASAVKAPFHIVNREALFQTDPTFLRDFRGVYPSCELAVVAGPFDAFPHPDLDKGGWETHVRDEGWLTLPMAVEAYVSENPNATPLRQAAEAHERGFQPVHAVVESNREHGWSLDAIPDSEIAAFDGAISLYLLGTARDGDKARFARWAAGR